MATIAEVLYETLALSGVKRVYGLPGDSLNGFTDSIGKHKNMRWIHVRHEEAASFAAGAEACGLFGVRVTQAEELKPALEEAFAHDGPALVDVLVHRQELSMPPTITASQVLGFGLYPTKSVLNGRGDAIIDLAKTNLLNR